MAAKENTWLFTEHDFLYKSPSRRHITVEQELKTREAIYDFIIRLGSALKLDAKTIFVATIYMNRFYMKRPITQSKYFVASAAIAISCKLNDTYRLPDKIALTGCILKNPNPNIVINENSEKFWQWRDELLYREELILKELNFELNLQLPYDLRNTLIELPDDPNPLSKLFNEKKMDIIKNTVALIESISSLPILMAFDINIVFPTMMMIIVLEAQAKFNLPIQLPPYYILNNFDVDLMLCLQCYKYLITLIGYSQRDSRNISNKAVARRIKKMSDEEFLKVSNEER